MTNEKYFLTCHRWLMFLMLPKQLNLHQLSMLKTPPPLLWELTPSIIFWPFVVLRQPQLDDRS